LIELASGCFRVERGQFQLEAICWPHRDPKARAIEPQISLGAVNRRHAVTWGKRQFSDSEFARYHDRLVKLLYRYPTRYREFMMVNTKTENPSARMYYVGVPTDVFMQAFDGFELVKDQDLPKEIDTVIVADVRSDEFENRFQFRNPLSS
jgi:hypothetical protein